MNDECRRQFSVSTTMKPPPPRERLSTASRRMNEKVRQSYVTLGTLPAFEGAGVDVAHEFVRGDNIGDDYVV